MRYKGRTVDFRVSILPSAYGENCVIRILDKEQISEEFKNLSLDVVGFDPEEFMAKYLGDAAAHRLHQGLKTLFGWGRRTADTLALDTAEYLREETRSLARASDVNDWIDAVESLRDAADRVEARLERLEQNMP